MEIKKREVIFSLVIISIMLILGLCINSKIKHSLLEKYQEYDTSVRIDTEEQFRYGMRTNIGNAFVYGELNTVDPVTYPEIDGNYYYIEKKEQEYTKHQRTETYKDDNGNTKTRTVDYWTWDTKRTESKTATRITFLNVEFNHGMISFPPSHEIAIVKTGNNKRNVYYGTDTTFSGTIYTSLKNNTINNTEFYNSKTISDTIDSLESGYQLVLFWILWILLTAGLVFGFYYLENNWLD